MKKETKVWMNGLAIIGIVLAVWLAAISTYAISQIEAIKEVMDDAPKRVCWNETTIEKVTVPPSQERTVLLDERTQDITCESDVEFYFGTTFVNWNRTHNKTCLISTTKEVCEIR